MPYFPEKLEIATKLFGVSFKIDDIGRQQFLGIMRDTPEKIENMFLMGSKCHIVYEGNEYTLGVIDEKYSSLINSHDCEITQWKVTGGYEIIDNGYSRMATFGCNVVIKLSKRIFENDKKKIVLQNGNTNKN